MAENTFDEVLKAIDSLETDPDRHLSIQMDQRLRDAIRAAKASGKPAKISVEIKVSPGPDRRVIFAGGVKATLPNPPTNSVTLYADDAGQVHHSDPAQLTIPGTRTAPRAVKE